MSRKQYQKFEAAMWQAYFALYINEEELVNGLAKALSEVIDEPEYQI